MKKTSTVLKGVPDAANSKRNGETVSMLLVIKRGLNTILPAPAPVDCEADVQRLFYIRRIG